MTINMQLIAHPINSLCRAEEFTGNDKLIIPNNRAFFKTDKQPDTCAKIVTFFEKYELFATLKKPTLLSIWSSDPSWLSLIMTLRHL